MIKKKNNKTVNLRKKKLIFSFLIILFFIIFIIGFCYFKYGSTYMINSRVNNLKKYEFKNDVKVNKIGWIRVQGTNVDYPVIAYDDPISTILGEGFAWTRAKSDKLYNKTLIVGHNYQNVSKNPIIGDKNHTRFEQLMAYIYYDFVKDNKYIQYTVNGKDYLFKIFAISFNTIDNNLYRPDNLEKSTLKKYINREIKNSYFDFDVDVNENDKIITLSTCTRMFGQYSNKMFIIDARLVRDGESTENYDVKKNDSYNSILDIMKGGEENEKV